MIIIKIIFRFIIAPCMFYLGFPKILRGKNTQIYVVFHGVTNGKNRRDSINVKQFIRLIKYFVKLKKKGIVIKLTFDDGQYNFFNVALKILEKYNYPAILFLCFNHPTINVVNNIPGQHQLLTYGYHIYGHPDITKATKKEYREIIYKASECVKSLNGLLAYPYSKYSAEDRFNFRKMGYKKQFAVDFQDKNDHLFQFMYQRHCISNTTNFYSNVIQINRAFKTKGF